MCWDWWMNRAVARGETQYRCQEEPTVVERDPR
jgi:hypothetical protein